MFKNIRNLVVGLLAAATLVAVPLAASGSAYAAADIQNAVCNGSDLKFSGTGDCSATQDGANKIDDLITKIINVFSVVVGVTAVIMIIFGGFRYITSGGDSGNITTAKNTIIYAIIGLVIVALAQFIVKFVLNRVTQ